jgi:hypothetical protein
MGKIKIRTDLAAILLEPGEIGALVENIKCNRHVTLVHVSKFYSRAALVSPIVTAYTGFEYLLSYRLRFLFHPRN